jgi:hypothetical protein
MTTNRQPTRRHFLQTVAAAGAATILPASSTRVFGADSPNERPVFASIGKSKRRPIAAGFVLPRFGGQEIRFKLRMHGL